MAFGDSLKKPVKAEARPLESPFLKLAGTQTTIRIRDDEEYKFRQYWIPVNIGNGVREDRPIVVEGWDGPIDQYMRSLGEDHPDFKFGSKQWALNVLDRTPVIEIDGVVHRPNQDGQFSVRGVPRVLNRPYILKQGPMLMEQFALLHEKTRKRFPDSSYSDFLPIQRFDVLISSYGTGRSTKYQARPDYDMDPLPSELEMLPRYNMSRVIRPMPHDAQQALLDGEDYTEVMKTLNWEPVRPLWT